MDHILDCQKQNKGQTLLFVFMLLLLLTFIVGALALMWESGLQVNALQKDSISAFYLAEAGRFRALDCLADTNGTVSDCQNLTGDLGSGSYLVDISGGGGASPKNITSRGFSATAERVVYDLVRAGNCKQPKDGCPPYGNAWGYWKKTDNKWREE